MSYLQENWIPVKGLEIYFDVSNLGNIKSKARKYLTGKYQVKRNKPDRILTARITKNYRYIMMAVSDKNIKYRKEY